MLQEMIVSEIETRVRGTYLLKRYGTTSLDWVWKGGGKGPDSAFPLLFHENPESRTFFMAIPNPVFCFPTKTISAKANKMQSVNLVKAHGTTT